MKTAAAPVCGCVIVRSQNNPNSRAGACYALCCDRILICVSGLPRSDCHGIQIICIIQNMNRTQTVAKLQSYADAIKALGATSLFLFGSTARNENNLNSDLDLFVDYDPNGKFNALDLVDIKLLLEDSLGLAVDVTTRDSLHPMLRDDIEKSAVRVF